MRTTMNKKILMIIAPRNYKDRELEVPKKLFEDGGFQVTIASKSTNLAFGVDGGQQKVDMDISEANVNNFDCVIFIGGAGAEIYFNDLVAHQIVRDAVSSGKVLGAICISPSTLANAGVLQDKKATSFLSERENLEQHGAQYTMDDVTVDGNIVTASGPGAANRFGAKIMELLSTK